MNLNFIKKITLLAMILSLAASSPVHAWTWTSPFTWAKQKITNFIWPKQAPLGSNISHREHPKDNPFSMQKISGSQVVDSQFEQDLEDKEIWLQKHKRMFIENARKEYLRTHPLVGAGVYEEEGEEAKVKETLQTQRFIAYPEIRLIFGNNNITQIIPDTNNVKAKFESEENLTAQITHVTGISANSLLIEILENGSYRVISVQELMEKFNTLVGANKIETLFIRVSKKNKGKEKVEEGEEEKSNTPVSTEIEESRERLSEQSEKMKHYAERLKSLIKQTTNMEQSAKDLTAKWKQKKATMLGGMPTEQIPQQSPEKGKEEQFEQSTPALTEKKPSAMMTSIYANDLDDLQNLLNHQSSQRKEQSTTNDEESLPLVKKRKPRHNHKYSAKPTSEQKNFFPNKESLSQLKNKRKKLIAETSNKTSQTSFGETVSSIDYKKIACEDNYFDLDDDKIDRDQLDQQLNEELAPKENVITTINSIITPFLQEKIDATGLAKITAEIKDKWRIIDINKPFPSISPLHLAIYDVSCLLTENNRALLSKQIAKYSDYNKWFSYTIVEMLLTFGADPNGLNNKFGFPLTHAAFTKQSHLLEVLKNYGAKINQIDPTTNKTALYALGYKEETQEHAAADKDFNTATTLIALGAKEIDQSIVDRFTNRAVKTAVTAANTNKQKDITDAAAWKITAWAKDLRGNPRGTFPINWQKPCN